MIRLPPSIKKGRSCQIRLHTYHSHTIDSLTAHPIIIIISFKTSSTGPSGKNKIVYKLLSLGIPELGFIPLRNLSSWQRWECLEIVDYSRLCLEIPMKQEKLELVIVDYPRNFLYWKLNYEERWSASAFPSVPNMFVKVVGIPAIFDNSQLLADYHWHFHA